MKNTESFIPGRRPIDLGLGVLSHARYYLSQDRLGPGDLSNKERRGKNAIDRNEFIAGIRAHMVSSPIFERQALERVIGSLTAVFDSGPLAHEDVDILVKKFTGISLEQEKWGIFERDANLNSIPPMRESLIERLVRGPSRGIF